MMAARSAGIWIVLAFGDSAHAALRRDGLDPAALRLTGLHPFEFAPVQGGGVQVVAPANDDETAEALLDLFRVYFRLHLSHCGARFRPPAALRLGSGGRFSLLPRRDKPLWAGAAPKKRPSRRPEPRQRRGMARWPVAPTGPVMTL